MISLNCCYIQLLCLLMFPQEHVAKTNYYSLPPFPFPSQTQSIAAKQQGDYRHKLLAFPLSTWWKRGFGVLKNKPSFCLLMLSCVEHNLGYFLCRIREEMEMFFVVIVQLRSLVLHKAMICIKKRSIAKQFSCFSM